MARMVPSEIPSGVESNAECRCFDSLRDNLDGSFTVLFDVAWLGRGSAAGTQGQCDLLILHPGQGALVVEVKGGNVFLNEESGRWTSDGAEGRFEIDDPFRQASRSKFALRDYLRSCGQAAGADVLWGHAVWFPDSRADSYGPDAHPAITLDYQALTETEPAVLGAFAYWQTQYRGAKLSSETTEGMVNALGRRVTLTVPLAVTIQEEALEQVKLTEDQYNILSAIDRQQRVAVSGPAGSGKTMLAVEQCRRFAAAGYRTLYVCFNRRLALWVARQLEQLPLVKVNTFHGLLDDLAAESNVTLPELSERDKDYFERRAPDLLFDLASKSEPRFDAIVVDEAQDFHDWWLTAVEALLSADGREIIFFDDNQQVFARSGRASLRENSLRLPLNCRTTQAIHEALLPFHTGDVTSCNGPQGREPKRIEVNSDRVEAREVQRELFHLVKNEDIPLSRIVILTPRHETSNWQEGQKLGNFTLTWKDERDEKTQILCASIQSFKGMEADVVLVTEMSKVRSAQYKQMWYTACSRARHHLVVFEMEEGGREVVGIQAGHEGAEQRF